MPWAGYYSFDLGAWHVVVLNSNCAVIGCGAGSAQETWLRNDLAAHPNACTLALWHHPRYSSGGNGSSTAVAALYQALYDYGADVLVVGHDHDYERFNPQGNSANLDNAFGIREFVVGTGGETTGSQATHQPNSVVFSKSWGVIRLVLHPTGYDWQFVPVAGSTFTDSGPRRLPRRAVDAADAGAVLRRRLRVRPRQLDRHDRRRRRRRDRQGATVRTGTHALQLSAGSGSTSFAYARRSLAPALAQVTASTDFRVADAGRVGRQRLGAALPRRRRQRRREPLPRQRAPGEVWLKYDNADRQDLVQRCRSTRGRG